MRNRGVSDSSVFAILVDGSRLPWQTMGRRPCPCPRRQHRRCHALPARLPLRHALCAATPTHPIQRPLAPSRLRPNRRSPIAARPTTPPSSPLLCSELLPPIIQQSSNLPHWDGYDYSQRITYRIEDITDPVTVFQGFDKQRRQRPIRRAEKTLTPFYDLTPEDFALFHADYWASRGEKDLLSYEFIVRIVNAALSRQQGLLLGLKDPDGRLHAARFVVFDNRCAYALLSALNPSGHHNGASPLLFWHIIQQLASRTQAFDFEGSMDPSIAFSYSLYGAKPTTYPHVTRFCNPIVKKLLQHKI